MYLPEISGCGTLKTKGGLSSTSAVYVPSVPVVAVTELPFLSLMVIVADGIGAPVARVPESLTFPLIGPREPPGVPVSVVVVLLQPVSRVREKIPMKTIDERKDFLREV